MNSESSGDLELASDMLAHYDAELRMPADLTGRGETRTVGQFTICVAADRAFITHKALLDASAENSRQPAQSNGSQSPVTQSPVTQSPVAQSSVALPSGASSLESSPLNVMRKMVVEVLTRCVELPNVAEISWRTRSHDQLNPATLLPGLGFQLVSTEATMLAEIDQLADLAVPSDCLVRAAGDGADLTADLRRFAFIHSQTLGPLRCVDELQTMVEADRAAVFLSYLDGQLASVGRVDLITDSCALLYGTGTLAEFRGRGSYRAQLAARLCWAAEHGARYVLTDAKQSSAPTLSRAGCQPITQTSDWVTMTSIVRRRLGLATGG